jgi:hypothetical protein
MSALPPKADITERGTRRKSGDVGAKEKNMSSIKYDRLYSDSGGRSCVQKNLEIELVARDFVPPAPPIGVSALAPASTYAFLLVPAGFIGDWHPTPKRQWLFYLQGEMEHEAGDGTKWRVGPGPYHAVGGIVHHGKF